MRCQFCVEVRSQRVIAQGVSKKEITEAIAVAMFIAGGSRLDKHLLWKRYDLAFEEKKSEEPAKE